MPSPLFGDPAALARPAVLREELPSGGFVLRNAAPLQPYVRCIGDWLEHWAATTPDAPFLAEREPASGTWRRLSYGAVRGQVGRIAQALLDLALPAAKPVVVLSDNSIDHALLLLAGLHLGRPVCTVSSAYCRLTKDYAKVHGMLDALDPALIYAAEPGVYGAPIMQWRGKVPVVFSRDAASVPQATAFEALLA
ncbi:MAG: AMP-binding protein, partial [Burkholderiales bacterium]|nr:AMP-binding protein [Burkholderiales bacterium]